MDWTVVCVAVAFSFVIAVREWVQFRKSSQDRGYWLAMVEKREHAAQKALEQARISQTEAHSLLLNLKLAKKDLANPEIVQRLAAVEHFLQTGQSVQREPTPTPTDTQKPPGTIFGRMTRKTGGNRGVRVRRSG